MAQAEKKREKKEYSMEVVETAENIYIYKQKTYEEISQITGIPVVTVQRWSALYKWREKKIEHIKKRVEYRHTLYTVQENMLERAKTGSDPQIIHGLAALQKLIEAEEKVASSGDSKPNPEVFLGFMRDMVVFLKDRDSEALTALEKNFDDFIDWAKNKYV